MNYNEREMAREIFMKLEQMERVQNKIAKQVEEMYNDFEDVAPRDNVTQVEEPWDSYPDETVKKLGQRIAYNLMDSPNDVSGFRDFIYQAKTHPRLFNDIELKYIDIADKNFDDIRLSRKHLGILQAAYPKAYPGKIWPFKVRQGYMYKYGNQMVWEFFE
jgi:hypothetical protein